MFRTDSGSSVGAAAADERRHRGGVATSGHATTDQRARAGSPAQPARGDAHDWTIVQGTEPPTAGGAAAVSDADRTSWAVLGTGGDRVGEDDAGGIKPKELVAVRHAGDPSEVRVVPLCIVGNGLAACVIGRCVMCLRSCWFRCAWRCPMLLVCSKAFAVCREAGDGAEQTRAQRVHALSRVRLSLC